MKRSIIFSLALAVSAAVLADPYSSAMKRAKDVSGRVTQRENQAINNAAAPQQPQAPPAAQPANPAVLAMQQNIANIAADLMDLQKNPARKQTLVNNLNAAAQGKNPTKASVAKLADDLASAVAGKNLSQEQRTKLAQFARAAFNGSHVSPAQEKTVLAEAQKILQTAGIPAATATKITEDLKTIAAETR